MPQPLPSFLQPNVSSVARHEMGHFVAARALGFRTGNVHLTFWLNGNHAAGASIEPATSITTIDEIIGYLKGRVIVLYAGSAAETLIGHAAEPVVDNEEAIRLLREAGSRNSTDYAKVRELVHLLRSVQHPQTDPMSDAVQSELNAIESHLWRRTIEIVEENSRAILGLASALIREVQFIGEPGIMLAATLEALSGVQDIRVVEP